MPDFAYTARNKTGLIQKDIMQALSERAVADSLRAEGLTPTLIRPVRKSFDIQSVINQLRPIKLLDKIIFIKNLGVMIRAGLPVSRSLKILTVQTSNPRFAKIVGEISRLVESGTSLADSMARYPNVFSPIFINMVHVGEVSGSLDQNLNYLADQMQRDFDLMSKARGALTYPIVIVVALGLVGFLMFTFVLPKLTETFKEFNTQLPFMTRVVISLVDVFAHYGILIFFGVVFSFGGLLYWRKTDSGKKVLHKAVFYMPIISNLVVQINLARFVRVFASLIKSGMSIVEALEISSHVVGNVYYQKTIAEAAAKVKVGSPLTAAFIKEPKLFSNLVIQMMEVGEESGTTDQVLTEVANFYEQEVDQTMKNMSSILEPVIMMVIGVVVGFLAVALITPIYSITQSA
jgi:type IV pilus assembly protein PilC